MLDSRIILSLDPDTILLLILLCEGEHGAWHELMIHWNENIKYIFKFAFMGKFLQ